MRTYRKDFAQVLHSSNSNLTKSRFMRLFILSFTLVVVMLPVQFYVFYRNVVDFPLIPYSWTEVHGAGWWDIILIPTGGVPTGTDIPFDHWVQIGLGFAVFFFFGLGRDAVKMYAQWLEKIGLSMISRKLQRQKSSRPYQPAVSGHDSFVERLQKKFARKSSRNSFLTAE